MSDTAYQVEEKNIGPLLVAAVRMCGKYSDCGSGFKKIGRKFGRQICGNAMLLCYDKEYRENDANYEVCMPIRQGESIDEIEVRELPGGKCLSLLHQGPYEELSRLYPVILNHAQEMGLEIDLPTREVFVKGPGMIFKGNPEKYLTEIQLMIRQS